MTPKDRFREKIQRLQAEWNVLHDSIAGLRRQIILETRDEETKRIRHILEERKNLMDEIEIQLEQLENTSTVKNYIDVSLSFTESNSTIVPNTSNNKYVPSEIHPYVVGEGINDDSKFFGRNNLIRDLRSLWRQPHGKPAIILIGQRRIGKTSLLNKIQRQGLQDTQLLPIVVNVQGCNSAYDFLSEVAGKMAMEANKLVAYRKQIQAERPEWKVTDERQIQETGIPTLNPQEPFVEFKKFLWNLQATLAGQRFLLMLDEAEEIKKLGENMPGFLRTLMQGAEYPILILFCGSYKLKRMAEQGDSILYNTVQARTVSYMDEEESAEVLKKPAQDILEFSPKALQDAYQVTSGQPLLLQKLGATLIQQFNAEFFNGKERSNYVSEGDMDKAIAILTREDTNMAFEEHWRDLSDTATRRVLAAMAWHIDEKLAAEVDVETLETAMRETGLELPRNTTLAILERLSEEEILRNHHLHYRFAVPLYQRWIAWRWRPEKVRLEELPG
jgi:hypothetical protein